MPALLDQDYRNASNGCMRFVFVQPHLEFGGAEKQTVSVANELVKRGHDVTIVLHSLHGGLLQELDERVVLRDCGLDGHVRIPIIAIRMRKILATLPPSLVIVKLWSSIMAVGLSAHKLQHQIVLTEDLDPIAHVAFIRFGRLKRQIVRRCFRRANVVVANTNAVAQRMIDVYGLASKPRVIYPCVDLQSMSKRRQMTSQPDDNVMRIASIGSLVPLKGLHVTAEALEIAKTNIEWIVIGQGPLDHWLESYAAKRGDGVQVVGPSLDPVSYLLNCDLLVHSATSEAFGVVVLEALAVGVPVIAANAVGPSEIAAVVNDTERLELVPRGSALALADALRERSARLKQNSNLPLNTAGLRMFDISTAADSWEEIARSYDE